MSNNLTVEPDGYTQLLLVIKQLFLVGPITLREALPWLSLFAATSILIGLVIIFRSFIDRSKSRSLPHKILTVFVAWVASSSIMIFFAYLLL